MEDFGHPRRPIRLCVSRRFGSPCCSSQLRRQRWFCCVCRTVEAVWISAARGSAPPDLFFLCEMAIDSGNESVMTVIAVAAAMRAGWRTAWITPRTWITCSRKAGRAASAPRTRALPPATPKLNSARFNRAGASSAEPS